MIGRNLRSLSARIYSTGGKAPVPGTLLNAISALSDVREDTAFGFVHGKYQTGDHPNHPRIGAKYTIWITLH